jgi:hypothetical protein
MMSWRAGKLRCTGSGLSLSPSDGVEPLTRARASAAAGASPRAGASPCSTGEHRLNQCSAGHEERTQEQGRGQEGCIRCVCSHEEEVSKDNE